MSGRPCPICHAETKPIRLPVSVRRAGRTVFELAVPAAQCADCGHLDIDDATQEEVIAELEQHSSPGDDIVFPEDA